jgi:hypothetical protein
MMDRLADRAFAFVEVILAVLQLRDANGDRLGPFARELLHLLQFLPQLLGVGDLLDDLGRDVLVAIEEVQQLLAHGVHQLGANPRVACRKRKPRGNGGVKARVRKST